MTALKKAIKFSATIHEIQRFCNLVNINIIHRTTKDTQIGKVWHLFKSFFSLEFSISFQMTPWSCLAFLTSSGILRFTRTLESSNQKDSCWTTESHRIRHREKRSTKPYDSFQEAVEQCIPFSLGKRACAGEGLARLELFIGLTSILQRYKVFISDS